MSKTNKWFSKLSELEGAVVGEQNPFAKVLEMPSPSVGFIFGNGHGLPFGYTSILYGGQKSGKTILANAIIERLHADDPEAIAVKFDTEYRERVQKRSGYNFKIDPERFVAYETNEPDRIFDRIEQDIGAMCQEGAPIKLIVIDSITSIQGRRAGNADSVMTQQIGDLALTLQDGFKRILPVQRKYNIAVLLTAQVRAEMDRLEVMRGNSVKMASSWGVKHYAEYFIFVERDMTLKGKTDLLGQALTDSTMTDMNDNEEQVAYKVRATMKGNSCGPNGRQGQFTFHRTQGIINVHEEVFLLGLNRGIITKPSPKKYAFGGKEWTGQPAIIEHLKADTEMQKAIIKELRAQELAGTLKEPIIVNDEE